MNDVLIPVAAEAVPILFVFFVVIPLITVAWHHIEKSVQKKFGEVDDIINHRS